LQDRIQSGEFEPGRPIPTERELGEEYGVSRITVIKALDMLEHDGYILRQQGRGTFIADPAERAGTTNGQIVLPTLGFVSFAVGHPYLSSILVGIAGVAAQQGYPLHVFGSVKSSLEEKTAINDAVRRGVQGLIVNPWREYRNAPLYADLQGRGFPLVMVDRYYTEIASDYVIFENEQAGFALTSALIGQGHTRIAVIPSQEQRTTSVHERLNGYRRALEAHGLDYDEDLIWSDLPGTFISNEGRLSRTLATDELLRHHMKTDKPTGLLAVNIDVAELLIDAFCSDIPCMGLRTVLTSNLAMATFNHTKLPSGTPLVSAIALHPGETLGAAAANILTGRLNGTLPPEPQRLHMPMSILQMNPNQDSTVASLDLLEYHNTPPEEEKTDNLASFQSNGNKKSV
jgi:DNA-binding LacI/PurR family transcriptional regulator